MKKYAIIILHCLLACLLACLFALAIVCASASGKQEAAERAAISLQYKINYNEQEKRRAAYLEKLEKLCNEYEQYFAECERIEQQKIELLSKMYDYYHTNS